MTQKPHKIAEFLNKHLTPKTKLQLEAGTALFVGILLVLLIAVLRLLDYILNNLL
ncbi:MAG: hypothetical protein OXC42_00575 [Gammaproteobacteria bacterium]|nr:hypothetical protein [Gammaproteobacteria bacterium]